MLENIAGGGTYPFQKIQNKRSAMYNPTDELYRQIKNSKTVNAHCHLDRAYTVLPYQLDKDCNKDLKEKWRLVDRIKASSTEEDYYNRIMYAIEQQKRMGVSKICSFIDIDSIAEYRAIEAALQAKIDSKEMHGVNLYLACQTLKGLADRNERKRIENVIDKLDIIGSLPSADKDKNYHLDVVCDWAKQTKKQLHVHIDQMNSNIETETELLLMKIMEHKLENKVTAIHGISIACHGIDYRNRIYNLCKNVGLSFITCPSAWIDHKRNEMRTPFHNSITPVDELIKHNISVAMGTDNICDVYKPFSTGDMFFEIKLLLEVCHLYNYKELLKIISNDKVLP